jgi:DNA-binding GntR family transcriptional regulator
MAEQAYKRIRQMFFEQELRPGSRVSEAVLTRQLGMSRTPVREALTKLEGEGLLVSAPGRGYIVTEFDVDDLVDVYHVRAALDGLAAEEAVRRINRVDLVRLEELYDAMAAACKADDGDEPLASLNSSFHALIAEISGNNYLQTMLEDIRDVFERFRTTALTAPGRRDEAHADHGLLLEALRRGDPAEARRVATQHVYDALETRRGLFAQMREESDRETRDRNPS